LDTTLIAFRCNIGSVSLFLLLLGLAIEGGHLEGLLLAHLLGLQVAELEILGLLLHDRLLLANLLRLLLALNVTVMGLSGPLVMESGELAHLDLLALPVLVPGDHLVGPRLRLAHLLGLDVADLLGLLDKGVLAGRPVVEMVAVESIWIGLWFRRGCGKSSSQQRGENESLHVVSGASGGNSPGHNVNMLGDHKVMGVGLGQKKGCEKFCWTSGNQADQEGSVIVAMYG